MLKANADIRDYASERGVRLWEVAEKFGCNDSNFSRKLRREFSGEEKKKIRVLIDQIAAAHKSE